MTPVDSFADDALGRRRGHARYLSGAYWAPTDLLGDDQLVAAVTEVSDLSARATEAKRLAVEAGHAVERARADDEQARADAVRAAKPRPKPTVDAAEAKRERVEEDEAALWKAAEQAARDALDVLAERGPALAAKLRKEVDGHREKLVAAVAEVERCGRALEAADQLATWVDPADGELTDWQRHSAKRSRLPRVKLPKLDAGANVDDAVALLRQIVGKHEAAQGHVTARHLREVA